MYIIPKPQKMELQDGVFLVQYEDRIVLDDTCSPIVFRYAQMLQEEMEASLGYSLAITKGQSKRTAVRMVKDAALEEEGYCLRINAEGIFLAGGAEPGILYGVETLRQILRQCGAALPFLSITDFPERKHRGMFYDVTRGRVPTMAYLKKLADTMAFYKLNQLQLYIEHSFLFEDLSEVWRDDTPLTAEEIMELDEYCADRNIELIPSIASFGHLYEVLRTKSFGHLCEIPGSVGKAFGFADRMDHYTVDASNPESIALVKRLIEEYMPLFRSQYFNIGADETFDLGKGKSKQKAEEIGIKRLYMDYVKELCFFLSEKGKIPMFWGDIICQFPEAIKELPPETVCLNWGYEKYQEDTGVKALAEAGATQYCCPGVSGWNQFVNQLDVAYENIRRMCTYASVYHAEGVLTTDWGDFGHINHPDFGIAGLIYGAAFSWKLEEADFEEMNRQISRVEFGDESERLVSLAAEISGEWIYKWEDAVLFMERGENAFTKEQLSGIGGKIERLAALKEELYRLVIRLDREKRKLVKPYLVAVDGMTLLQKTGVCISAASYQTTPIIDVNPTQLAGDLEEWFYEYKKVWRSVSRESELFRLQDAVCWYADYLRDISLPV